MELCDKPINRYMQAPAALLAHPDEPRQKLGITGEGLAPSPRGL
jgi:hypothetical protein